VKFKFSVIFFADDTNNNNNKNSNDINNYNNKKGSNLETELRCHDGARTAESWHQV
jgi:hypothetical protein